MLKKIKVLVDGVGGDVGQGVVKALLDSNLNIDIYVSCISIQSSWLHKIEKSFVFPFVDEDRYIEYLVSFLNKHKVDVFFPTVDSALQKIAKYKKYIEDNTNAIVFVDEIEKIEICSDKLLTNDFLLKNNFSSPVTSGLARIKQDDVFFEKTTFPVVVKPRSGNGAKDVLFIDSMDGLHPFFGRNDLLVQQYLNIALGEITAGIYLGDDAEIKGIYILKRELKAGSTYRAERIFDEKIESSLIDIAIAMNMKYINIQAVYQDGLLLPFEFNGRLSGTTGVMRSVFNAPEMFIRERYLKEKLKKNDNRQKLYFSRYSEEVIYTDSDIANLKLRSDLNE